MKTPLLPLSFLVAIACCACSNQNTPARCVASKNYIEIYGSGLQTYVFDDKGISIHADSSTYKLAWQDIKEFDVGKTVYFGPYKESIKKTEMTLSVASNRRDTPPNTDLGMLEAGCWNDLLSFVDKKKIDVQISMKIQTVDDPKQP